jgi:two-component system LytT family response regulator
MELDQPVAEILSRRLLVRAAGRLLVVPLGEIDCIVAGRHHAVVHVRGGRSYRVHSSLAGLEQQLAGHAFLRIHRSVIVNLQRVRELLIGRHGVRAVVLEDGRELPVGRGEREALRRALEGAEEAVS